MYFQVRSACATDRRPVMDTPGRAVAGTLMFAVIHPGIGALMAFSAGPAGSRILTSASGVVAG
jgi:hypothetical protein